MKILYRGRILKKHVIEGGFCEHILRSKIKKKQRGIELRGTNKSGAVTRLTEYTQLDEK